MEPGIEAQKGAANVRQMFDSIAPRYDLLNTVLSGGIHKRWRREALELAPKNLESVLDLCCGTGDLLPLLKQRAGSVIGVDFSGEMLRVGKDRHRLPIIQGDALSLPFKDCSFDLVSVAFGVRNFENLEKGLLEVRRVLRPHGTVLILEFGQRRSKVFAGIYNLYSNYVMPQIGAALSGNGAAYKYLPKTAKKFPCGEKFTDILKSVGLSPKEIRSHCGGIAYTYVAVKA